MPRYIDADTLMDDIDHTVRFSCRDGVPSAEMRGANKVIDRINAAPTLSPDEVRGVGEWLPNVGKFGYPEFPCSVCGYKSGHYGFNYCPSCGARMKGASDSE